MKTSLKFLGDLNPWLGILLASGLALGAWFLYRRETRDRDDRLRWLLPLLRSLAVFLIVLALTGPILHHEKVIRELGRLFVFVDASGSMEMVDEEMPEGRKAAAMQAAGYLPRSKAFEQAEEASAHLARAQLVATRALKAGAESAELSAAIGTFGDHLEEAFDPLENFQGESAQFAEQLTARVERLAQDGGDPFARLEELQSLRDQVLLMQERLTESVRSSSLAYLDRNREKPEFKAAIGAFDGASRLERMRKLLLDEDTGILRKIAKQQDIELVALTNRDVETMWWQRRAGKKSSGAFPNEFAIGEKGYLTDLSHTIGAMMEGEDEGVGAILFTDGQHNAEGSPVDNANVFGERGTPLFTIGYGNESAPMDMALTEVTGPSTVYAKDEVSGEILLRDSMRPGIPYRVAIEHDGVLVWEEEIESDNTMLRCLDYQFPVRGLVDKITAVGQQNGIEMRAVALQFKVSVTPVGLKKDESGRPIERITENNTKSLFVQAVAHPKKVLILDSRPRWETRYLNAMFERDEQWESNLLMEVFPPDQPQKSWERGDEIGMFPSSREELFTYEVIFFGDVPRRLFRDDELEWLAEFVGSRAGGMVFIDGQRNFLTHYRGTHLGKLLPVDRGVGDEAREEGDMPTALGLTTEGSGMNELRFASSGGENAEIWGRLRPPAWTAPAKELPGSQVMVDAIIDQDRRVPMVVTRRYGAGTVLYIGTDELWRWRYNVGDRYHQKFWVQMTNWVAEQPFSVKGKNVSIAADKMVYDPGGKATLRVRVRDDKGRSVDKGDFVAILYRDGHVYSEVELDADPNQGGIFRARTGSLEGGDYQIAIKRKYLMKKDREFGARAGFVVRAGDNRELDNLSVNRELLETVARNSGGQYFAEEEARNLVNLLESIDRKKVISSETNLWSSYWWFTAIIGLLVAEWVLRKRAGYL